MYSKVAEKVQHRPAMKRNLFTSNAADGKHRIHYTQKKSSTVTCMF